MPLTIEGHGFVTELDTSPDSLTASGEAYGRYGFVFADFTYTGEGSAKVWVNGAQIGACLSPRGVTMRHGAPHQTRQNSVTGDSVIVRAPGSVSGAHWREGFRGRFLTFSPEAIEHFFHIPLRRINFNFHDAVFPVDEQPVMSHLLAAVASDVAAGSPGGPMLLVETLSAAALRSIVDLPTDPKKAERGLTSDQARTVRALIVERSAEPLSLVDIAGAVGMSVGHMLRSFKITFGVTPHQYIIRQRVDSAVALLRTTSMSLDEIAIDCGFGTKGQMARTFRTTLGAAPKTIRNG